MNLFDSSFLCLDIGTHCVRGIAHRVRSGRIDKSATYSCASYDTVFALKSVIDELERQIGAHFESAYITGNLGDTQFDMTAKSTTWNTEHKITANDLRTQITQIVPPDGFYPIHIVPLRYDTPGARNMLTPLGHIDRQLISAFGTIFYSTKRMNDILDFLRRAHIRPQTFHDPQFLQNEWLRSPRTTTMFIDMGAEFTSASIWTDRGPVWFVKIPCGGTEISSTISKKLNLDFDEADRIKHAVACLTPKEMDRFTPADTAYDFSRADVNDIILPYFVNTVCKIRDASGTAFAKYNPTQIILSGGGAETDGATEFFENTFGLPVKNMLSDATVRALSEYIWKCEESHRNAYIARRDRWRRRIQYIGRIFKRTPRTHRRFIPILPSTLCFDMSRPETYSLFKSGGISIIHIDIMDGFYVDRVAGGIDQIKYIRAHTDAHLHVHLMTEGPTVWASDAIAAGADTIIVSTNTSGVRNALRTVRVAGRRAGVALNPESSVTILKPILREVDEIMVMTVSPGAAGQEFNPECLHKISVLAETRKKYGLKFTISADGGINDKTAQMCWDAGADLLVSGSYLAKSPDFPLAVQSLLRKPDASK